MRIYRILPVFLLVVSLIAAGCTRQGSVEPTSSAPTTTPTASTAAQPDPETTEPSTAPQDPGSSQPPTPEVEEVDDAFRGTLQGQCYQNDYMGITCTLTEDWQLNANEPGYDIQGENTLNKATMHITLKNLTQMEQTAYAAATDEEVVDIVLLSSDTIQESYAQAGIHVTSIGKETVTFLGQEHWCVYTVCDVLGANYYIVQLFEYDLGPVAATVTIAAFSRSAIQDILTLFQPIPLDNF